MTDEEKKEFHELSFKSLLANPNLEQADIVKFDIASVRLSFGDTNITKSGENGSQREDALRHLFKILSLNYELPDGGGYGDDENIFERRLRRLEFAMVAAQIEHFAANPVRRKQQILVDKCLSKKLVGLNYEEAMKKLKRYIKHTIFQKTYLDRKFTKALTYEEQEQEILKGNSLERDLAGLLSEEAVEKLYHKYRFDQICVYLTTTKKEISSKINACEKGMKDLKDAIFALGPATQQEAISMCEFVHDEYNKMKRTLDDVTDEWKQARDTRLQRLRKTHAYSKTEQAEVQNLEAKVNDLKSELRRKTQKNQAYQSLVYSKYYFVGGLAHKLFGSTVSEIYDQSMDNDSFDLVEKLVGHGGHKNYYDHNKIDTDLENELYAEMESIELARIRSKSLNDKKDWTNYTMLNYMPRE
eukprot:g9040.t1